ncbi:dipeptide ABC transporter ATP-binding protein [Corynebacterium poyangense]|uniref:Dipeptide ABC transporter ATP-binding protein n=1 Tax=Corynebacterium poyangense TaxID=2684405 RepID=A0A7H0SQM1_9CORY|nr:ABC transporter ATP-binding protein [Corynebacterium poyangense]MBZ8178261.1 dipeptide ABC transporter ATP-binding protein [Corynebacterium poyangense]QNQ90846.1 dipeptide ABC transporter ATP-binding protein [Corynebacterium poyangense]
MHSPDSTPAAPLLYLEDLNVSYQTSRGTVPAVSGVHLEVSRGHMTAIVGESGSGKSTTAQAAIGLLPAHAQVSGTITLAGTNVSTYREQQWQKVRGLTVGLIPQDPGNSLNPVKTIGDSVAEGLGIHRRSLAHKMSSRRARREKVLDLLDKVGIDDPERRAQQYPHELSGGMKQRVLIAAALALEPDLIIADEPTSALDVTVQKKILDLLDDMRKDTGILLITHDLAVAGDRADRVVVMERGEVRESGHAAQVLADPRHPYSRRLLADAPSLHTEYRRRTPVDSDPIVEVRNLSHQFGDFHAIDDISFQVARGSTHALVGESGSGKTTTGRSIAGFIKPTSGQVLVNGEEVPTGKAVKEFRRTVQLVYQNPWASLDPRWSIGKSIAEPLGNYFSLTAQERDRKVKEALELVSLNPDLAQRRPGELSGGQRQRVAIARALVVEPELVVLDEAVSALDVTVQSQILKLLDHLQQELNLTYIFISHDLAVVRAISDSVSVLQRGRQVESGPTQQIFGEPATEYTKTLIEAIPGRRYREGALNLGL